MGTIIEHKIITKCCLNVFIESEEWIMKLLGWSVNCFELVNTQSIETDVFFHLLHATVWFLTDPIAEIDTSVLQLTLLLKVKAKALC